MSLSKLIEHPRHAILDEMRARGWDDDALIKGMDQKTALAALLYVHVSDAERVPAGDGVLAAIERRFGVSGGFLQRLDDQYRAAILRALEQEGR